MDLELDLKKRNLDIVHCSYSISDFIPFGTESEKSWHKGEGKKDFFKK